MRHTLNFRKDPNLQIIVITSAVIHLLLITFIVVPLKTRKDEYRNYFVDLVGPIESFRETSPPEISKTEKTNGIKEPLNKPIPKADMSLEPARKVSKEIERMRAISALSKLKKKKEAENAHEIEVIRQKIQGGVAKAGIPGTMQSMGSDPYYASITRKIWSEWIYPESNSSGLEVIIAVKIDRDGKVVSREIEKSSGDTLFDRSALKAISKASPLPPPPVEIEIGIRFYL